MNPVRNFVLSGSKNGISNGVNITYQSELTPANMSKLSRKDRPSHPYGKGLIKENFGIVYEPGAIDNMYPSLKHLKIYAKFSA